MSAGPPRSTRLLLASGSPRRLELLRTAGFSPEIVTPGTVERRQPGESPGSYVERNALEKASAVVALDRERARGSVVLAADTVVVSPEGEVLEKPEGPEDARRMLRSLSGRVHRVLSAWAIVDGATGRVLDRGLVETRVTFRDLADPEVDRYVRSGEPMDKAGAYAIQGGAASFASRIEGSYTNVVGLPLAEVSTALRRHFAS